MYCNGAHPFFLYSRFEQRKKQLYVKTMALKLFPFEVFVLFTEKTLGQMKSLDNKRKKDLVYILTTRPKYENCLVIQFCNFIRNYSCLDK